MSGTICKSPLQFLQQLRKCVIIKENFLVEGIGNLLQPAEVDL